MLSHVLSFVYSLSPLIICVTVNDLCDEGTVVLSEALAVNTNLRVLDLQWNNITAGNSHEEEKPMLSPTIAPSAPTAGKKAISPSLSTSSLSKLVGVATSSSSLGDDDDDFDLLRCGIKALAMSLAKNRGLTSLNLRGL